MKITTPPRLALAATAGALPARRASRSATVPSASKGSAVMAVAGAARR